MCKCDVVQLRKLTGLDFITGSDMNFTVFFLSLVIIISFSVIVLFAIDIVIYVSIRTGKNN